MLIWNRDTAQPLYLRPIDPPGSPLIPLPLEGEGKPKWSFNPFNWSPDSGTFAVTDESQRTVALYSVPDAHEVGRWWADGYTLGSPGQWSLSYEWTTPGVWSPDGKYLLLTGSGTGSALFLIQRP
jgi:WD40 repeat protein